MQNDIFIVSNKISRIENLLEMYNVYDEDTYMNLHVILDDRHTTYNVESISDKITIHYATDVIAKVKHFFDEEWLLRILDVYGVAIKWLVFPYVHEILNINRAMMIDDDTLLLKPVDHYFFEPYVFYNESALGVMGKFVEAVLDPIYKDKVDITTIKKILEDGKILNLPVHQNIDNDRLVIVLTVSGKSKKVHEVLKMAKAKNIKTVTISAFINKQLKDESDLAIPLLNSREIFDVSLIHGRMLFHIYLEMLLH